MEYLILAIAVGICIYIGMVLAGRRTLRNQKAPSVRDIVSVTRGADDSLGVGETIVVVRNGKEL